VGYPRKIGVKVEVTPARLPKEGSTIAKDEEQMTALQDWLSLRPVDQNTIKQMVCRPLRAVLSTPDADERTELKLISPGVERC